jgi:hypothetical protein
MQGSFSCTWRGRAGRWSVAAYALTSLLLWPIPLLNVLHVESAAVLAGVAFVVSGLSSLRQLREGVSGATVVVWQVVVLAIPLVLMTIPVVWSPNCSYPTGLLFFVLFPVVSAVLACSVASLLHALEVPRSNTVFLAIAIGVAIFPPLYDIGLHPQLYTYNHVFGGILGPIYDEQLSIRPGLFAFRGLSLAWAATLWVAGRVATRRTGVRDPLTAMTFAASVGLVVAYSFSAQLGWNTTHAIIQESLGRSIVTDHFEVHYDSRSVRVDEIEEIADNMEYRYSVLSSMLATEIRDRVRVYIYPTAESKGSLTGSRTTSVAPVWLAHPQIHILKRRVRQSLDHELVHVFSREFGMPILRASPKVGLVEGLASALEAPDGRPSQGELMEAVIQDGSRDSVSVVDGIATSLGAFGFWTGRGAVSYAATGSFVRYLIEQYGVAALKSAYRTGDLASTYGKSRSLLAAEWYAAVRRSEPVSPSARSIAEARFSVPSLFEADCPHTVPGYISDYRDGIDKMSVYDTVAAVRLFKRSASAVPPYLPSRAALASIQLRQGDPLPVLASVATDTAAMQYPQMKVLVADAYAMDGNGSAATAIYAEVADIVPEYAAEIRMALWMRRRLASDASAARWYFRGLEHDPVPATLMDDPALSLFRVRRAISHDRIEEACFASLEWAEEDGVVFSVDERAMFSAQALIWRTKVCSGIRPEAAAAAGLDAEKRLVAAGELNLARYAADRAGFAQWKLSRTEGRRSSTPAGLSDDPHTP